MLNNNAIIKILIHDYSKLKNRSYIFIYIMYNLVIYINNLYDYKLYIFLKNYIIIIIY